jgi:eukaryotic-like serine/threonine-protein kinase
MKETLPDRVRIGVFELDLRAGELHDGGRIIRLQEKSLRVLQILVEHGGTLATREEIQKKLWPNDTVVDFEHGINTAILRLRQAMGDSADCPAYIETLARRGYRLMVPVEWLSAGDSSDQGAPSFRPPLAKGACPEAADRWETASGLLGKKVSHYRVLEVAGGGGMGLVYKAEDLKLGRRVALKFLPEELATDSLALRRFEREAQTASSLNHPNICTIYEVEEHEAQPFIVMELLEGETLRDRLAAAATGVKAIGLDELLDIALPITEGLQAAHDKGIIHRDIKPGNIFLTTQGQVKILDFGLAKLAAGEVGAEAAEENAGSSTGAAQPGGTRVGSEATLTRTGMAMGTAGYMSPEQVRGDHLDTRTDLFSFGLVLYEMATGQRAFRGDSAAVLKDAILNHTPVPLHDFNSTLPAKLEQITAKALEKDLERRYQTAAEIRADLKAIKTDAQPMVNQPSTRRVWKPLASVATALGIALVAAVGWLLYSQLHPSKMRNPLQQMSIERLTSDGKTTGSANISPDGKYVVYQAARGDKSSLWLRQVATSSSVKLVPESDDTYYGTTFSPDGDFIYYVIAGNQAASSGLYRVPTLGGTPQKILSNIGSPITFSHDGKQFAFIRELSPEGPTSQLVVAKVDGSDLHPLYTAKPPMFFLDKNGPSWSPNGTRIAVGTISHDQQGVSTGIAMVDFSGRLTPFVPKLPGHVSRLQWLNDGSGLIFCATTRVGTAAASYQGGEQIWFVSYPGGEVSRITNDLNSYGDVSLGVTADGSTLVTVQRTLRSGVWVVSRNFKKATQVTWGREDGWFAVGAGGGKIAYTSSPTGTRSIWIADRDGANPARLTPEGDLGGAFSFSPDGRSIAYCLIPKATSKNDVWIMDVDGSNVRQLTSTGSVVGVNFSLDGRWIYYKHRSEGSTRLFKIARTGGQPIQVSDLEISGESLSPRGDRMLMRYFDKKASQWRLGIISTRDGKLLRVIDRPLSTSGSLFYYYVPEWLDENAVFFPVTHNGVGNLWKAPLNGGPPVQLTHFTSDLIWNAAVADDGSMILGRGSLESDAILIHNFR